MNKIFALLFIIIIVAVAISAYQTPYDQIVGEIRNSTRFEGVVQAYDESTDTKECPSWSGMTGFCYLVYQTLKAGTAESPQQIPIVRFTVGQIRLTHTSVSVSWGLTWYDDDGNQINPENFQEGMFYTYHKTGYPAGFSLTITK